MSSSDRPYLLNGKRIRMRIDPDVRRRGVRTESDQPCVLANPDLAAVAQVEGDDSSRRFFGLSLGGSTPRRFGFGVDACHSPSRRPTSGHAHRPALS